MTTAIKTVTPELIAHIQAYNAEKMAWVAEDPDGRWAMTVCDDPAHWAQYEVYTVEEYELYMARAGLYDYHKDAYGFRPNWGWVCSLSLDEIEEEMNRLEVVVVESIEREKEWDIQQAERDAEYELEDAWGKVERTGDFSRFNDEIAPNLTTEQTPFASLDLVFS